MIKKVNPKFVKWQKLSKVTYYQLEEVVGMGSENDPFRKIITLYDANNLDVMIEMELDIPEVCKEESEIIISDEFIDKLIKIMHKSKEQ